jgi:hypothetical protein
MRFWVFGVPKDEQKTWFYDHPVQATVYLFAVSIVALTFYGVVNDIAYGYAWSKTYVRWVAVFVVFAPVTVWAWRRFSAEARQLRDRD